MKPSRPWADTQPFHPPKIPSVLLSDGCCLKTGHRNFSPCLSWSKMTIRMSPTATSTSLFRLITVTLEKHASSLLSFFGSLFKALHIPAGPHTKSCVSVQRLHSSEDTVTDHLEVNAWATTVEDQKWTLKPGLMILNFCCGAQIAGQTLASTAVIHGLVSISQAAGGGGVMVCMVTKCPDKNDKEGC